MLVLLRTHRFVLYLVLELWVFVITMQGEDKDFYKFRVGSQQVNRKINSISPYPAFSLQLPISFFCWLSWFALMPVSVAYWIILL